MTPERIAALVARWVRFYTRNLPPGPAQRRIEEIDADLHDQVAHERAHGRAERRIALSVLSRMLRGLSADASWRRHAGGASPVRRVLLGTALLLSVPLVAMRFTDQVAWTLADFVIAGVLLAGTGLLLNLVIRRARGRAHRAAAALAVAAAFVLIWLIGAVGVIGEDGDPADLMFAGVLAIGAIGAFATRLRPGGMARVLLAMAIAQMVVAALALILGRQEAAGSSVAEIIGLNALFAALFAGAAWLFRRAAQKQPG